MSINRVNISGNLTRDPELRVTASGTQVLSFGVAVNDRRRNPQTGEWEDYPNFVDCTMFGTRAEAVRRYLSKGSKVAIEGKLRYSSWEKDGERHDDYKWQKLVKCAEYYGCPEFEAHNSLGDAQATAWCWRHVQRDILARGGCDLEAEARDASDASRGVPCPNDPDMGQSAR